LDPRNAETLNDLNTLTPETPPRGTLFHVTPDIQENTDTMARPTFILRGEALFVHLIDRDPTSKKFQLLLKVSPEAAEPVINAIKEMAREEHPKEAKLNKVVLNHTVDEDGRVSFKFRTDYEVRVVDARNNPVTLTSNPGNGSTIKLKFSLVPGGKNGGPTVNKSIMLSPSVAMIVKLVEYQDGFGDDDVEEDADDYVAGSNAHREGEDMEPEADEAPAPAKAKRNIGF
jgi:hypothetical protein